MGKKKRKVQVVITTASTPQKILSLKTNKRRGAFWQNVTGGVKKKESPLIAAIREVIEETQMPLESFLTMQRLPHVFKFTDQWDREVTEYCFHFTVAQTWPVIIDPSEHQSFEWLSLRDFNDDLIKHSSNREVIHYIQKELEI